MSDVYKKKEEERNAQRPKDGIKDESESEQKYKVCIVHYNYELINTSFQANKNDPSTSLQLEDSTQEISRPEIIKRLRSRGAPIQLFGETHKGAQKRLRKMEIEQPELKEGWSNDFQSAMNKVDDEFVAEVLQGANKDQLGKLNVVVPDSESEKTWDQITVIILLSLVGFVN